MTDTLLAKLNTARAKCANPALDCTNSHFKNKYATLSSTLKEIKEACAGLDIFYEQKIIRKDNEQCLISAVVDKNGERYELSCCKLLEVSNPQQFGSMLTYTKRQLAQCDWLICGEEDDDANIASNIAQTSPKPARQASPRTQDSKERFIARIKELLTKLAEQNKDINIYLAEMNSKYGTDDLSKLTSADLMILGKHLSEELAKATGQETKQPQTPQQQQQQQGLL